MRDEILDIRDLSVSFISGGLETPAVKNISFTLKKGKTTAIVGESGSGKSVTALSLLRLLPSPPAVIRAEKMLLYDDDGNPTDLATLPDEQMRAIRGNRISMIFQEPMTSLNPVMRCGKQVMEAILAHRDISRQEAKHITLGLFREVMLPRPEELFMSYPHEISGGQKQRVMIAMAIASKPGILIADEPTTALDVTVQSGIIRLLKDLQAKYNMAILFITHDLGLVSSFADELIVMKNGSIVESGPSGKIFSNPQHPYTRGLLACRPRIGFHPVRLKTVGDYLNEENHGNTAAVEPVPERDEFEYAEKLDRIYSREPLLKTENLLKSFPSVRNKKERGKELRAVDDVSVKVYPGEVLGLVGESGCGKTTLGRTILRLITPTGGKIYYKGIDLTALKSSAVRKLRKEIQIIFQDPYSSLNPRLTIGQAIIEPMKVHRIGQNRQERVEMALSLLAKTGLEEQYFHRYPHELSGGQRQRACIARALSVRPEFIVCDESVSALDVSVQAQVLNLLKDLQEEFGFTYIFITHDLAVVNFISDRVAVMKDGKIIKTATADQITTL